MKKYNLSAIMKRAWDLVKKSGMTLSSALKKSWEEAKKSLKSLEEQLLENIHAFMESDHGYYIHLGSDREVSVKEWKKDGQHRKYLSILCFTLHGRYKGAYKCGYLDINTNQYVCGRYDDLNALTMEYVGR